MDQDKITNWIKSNCWDSVEIISTELHAVFNTKLIENYSLLPKNKKYLDDDSSVILKNIETGRKNLLLLTWKKLTER